MTIANLSPELEDKPPTPEVADGGEVLSWGNDCLQLHFLHSEHIAPRLLTIQHADVQLRDLEELRRSSLPSWRLPSPVTDGMVRPENGMWTEVLPSGCG